MTDAHADLTFIRSHWDDLREALEVPAVASWPPSGLDDYLRTLDAQEIELIRADWAAERAERGASTLGEHPAPLSLRALDVAREVQEVLLATCDQVAAGEPESVPEGSRWRYHRSWRHGAPWACTWLLGALEWAGVAEVRHIAVSARGAARSVGRVLGMARTHTRMDRPCPFCKLFSLTLHAGGGQDASVTCSTGSACTAPVLLDARGHRAWNGADLVDLHAALSMRNPVPA